MHAKGGNKSAGGVSWLSENQKGTSRPKMSLEQCWGMSIDKLIYRRWRGTPITKLKTER